jgi:PD-(D/E)XK nuclease superfamily
MVTVDNSALRAVARCSTEAWVRYVMGYTDAEERMELRAGTATHKALATFLTTGDVDAALAEYDADYQTWSDANVPPDHRLSHGNTSQILRFWCETHTRASLPFRIRHVELGFKHPLGVCTCGHAVRAHVAGHGACLLLDCACRTYDPILLTGRLDGLAEYQGALYVLEHKTTGRIHDYWIRRWRLDSQLSGYVWAAQRLLPQDTIVGVLLNAIEYSKLPTSDKRCPRHATPFHECGVLHSTARIEVIGRTPDQLAVWERTAVQLACKHAERLAALAALGGRLDLIEKTIAALPQEGTFNYSCANCGFMPWCAGGRRFAELGTNYVYDPWDPLAVETARIGTAHKP